MSKVDFSAAFKVVEGGVGPRLQSFAGAEGDGLVRRANEAEKEEYPPAQPVMVLSSRVIK